jgi:predicted membrane-bound mannosyltransferase/DNA-binding beta-propeller fold protein YncE
MQNTTEEQRSWLDRPLVSSIPALTYEILIFVSIILLAIASRFYMLGVRVMSHDESLHTYFSWLLFKGQGYQHSPMMHGPFQFHILALTYFLFGVNDFTSRIPAALFSVATVWMAWYWRRYLGKIGALAAAFLMLISPYMLFYGRYTRNEAYVGLFGLLTLYAMLRYLETGAHRYIYLFTTAVVLHFTSKETAFIYSAQALLFLAIFFVFQITRQPWEKKSYFRIFILLLAAGILLLGGAFGMGLYGGTSAILGGSETIAPLNPSQAASPLAPPTTHLSPALLLAGLSLIALLTAGILLIRGYGWERLRAERSFDLLILLGTLVIPQLTAFLVKFAGFNPMDYSTTGMIHTAYFLIPIALISIGIGLWWNRNLWIKNALVFYAIFIVLYTTVFTNSQGFFTGVIGSLGYWLEQQGVARGSQPWYYYLLIQIPIYEFLPALGSLLALVIGVRRLKTSQEAATLKVTTEGFSAPSLGLVGFWVISSLLAYTVAGEKMPWLTYHLTWPMILLSGWAIGQLIEHTDWAGLRQRHALLVILLMGLFLTSLTGSLLALLGTTPPFQGKELIQLQATANFTLSAIVAIASAAVLVYLLRDWNVGHFIRTFLLVTFALLAVLTIRAAWRASYIDYDNATEYLVYAHSAGSVKEVMAQSEEISRRTSGGLRGAIAYDASAPDTGVSWPFVWYLRDYTNQRSFDAPTRSLRDSDIIIVDQKNFDKIEPVVGQAYYRFDYIRMWWPNQDYFGITKERILQAIRDPRIRAGIFYIWLNRDYTLYAQATGSQSLTLTTWEPADPMRLYIRKDIAAKIWNYGVVPVQEAAVADPYEQNTIHLAADQIIGGPGQGEGQFDAPRAIAFAPDGSFYVTDSRNHRIQHFNADGTFLNAWGGFADSSLSPSPTGVFNEPWGVAVAPDGSVYVTDTWNHRVQKFTSNGTPITVWGHYGQAEQPDAFWGPRGICVDARGRVYVADTGNKRIVIFDPNGQYLAQFGSAGLDPGQFDEPVGVAVDANGTLYVTDTWNQRMQSFLPSEEGLTYTPYNQWDIVGWYGQSLDNKPFVAVDNRGHVFVTDPEGYRVLEFTDPGEFVQAWGDYGSGNENFGLAAGVAIDQYGRVWIVDAGNNRIMRFVLPVDDELPPAPSISP